MTPLKQAIEDFLSERTIAIAGASRNGEKLGNMMAKKFEDSGYTICFLHPTARIIDNHHCYASIEELPRGVHHLLLCTPPDASYEIARSLKSAPINMVWMHSTFGKGSYHKEAVKTFREKDVTVIPNACPMMYLKPVDPFHKCFRWIFSKTGRFDKVVE